MTLALDPSQVAAVELMCSAPFGIVTGGPGTGKTTCLRSALDELDRVEAPQCFSCHGSGRETLVDEHGRSFDGSSCPVCEGIGTAARYLLAAPTGKASRRMLEATGRASMTVHRLLDFGPNGAGMGFRRTAERPICAAAVFVDESSMLDTELAAALLAAIDPRTRLVLIGDAWQLPSVGPGRVFADLIESELVPVARLTKLHRAAAESWVCSQAPEILAGRAPDLEQRADFEWCAREDRDAAVEAAVELATKYGAQVLVPQNVGPAGADTINARLQSRLNPNGMPAWKLHSIEMRIGDAVIHCRNDYTLGVMNGETGRIVAADKETMRVDFGDVGAPRVVEYSRDQALALRLAYALTVHKSQGSEWPWLVVLCHSTHTRMLTRQLFYTAITRAKKGVVLVGDRKGMKAAVTQTRDADRLTALRHRLIAQAARARGEAAA